MAHRAAEDEVGVAGDHSFHCCSTAVILGDMGYNCSARTPVYLPHFMKKGRQGVVKFLQPIKITDYE